MRASRAEIKIEEILKEADLNFKMEYIFPDLKSPNGRPLRFDFVVFDDDGKIDFIISNRGRKETDYVCIRNNFRCSNGSSINVLTTNQ